MTGPVCPACGYADNHDPGDVCPALPPVEVEEVDEEVDADVVDRAWEENYRAHSSSITGVHESP